MEMATKKITKSIVAVFSFLQENFGQCFTRCEIANNLQLSRTTTNRCLLFLREGGLLEVIEVSPSPYYRLSLVVPKSPKAEFLALEIESIRDSLTVQVP
jgi:DNA-binding transcriptional regulator LsrR (DeoR family)